MNFIDAVRELKEGRCDAIKRPACTFTVESYRSNGIDFGEGKIAFEHFFATDWILINPKPQYEEVEVVRWCWNNGKDEIISKEKPCLPPLDYKLVKLTGTMQREIKPKVKRREEVKALSILDTVYPPDVKFFMEWEE